MKESWRWFGPLDNITVEEVAQTGASAVVTALHEIPYGEVWTTGKIEDRKALVETGSPYGLTWDVVESLPVHEDIKNGTGDLPTLFANYRQSLANLAACGVRTVCYNFMAILDWTRTDDAFRVHGGGAAMGYSAPRMAALEIFMLEREGAEADYSEAVRKEAAAWFEQSSQEDRDALLAIIMAGLPGAYDRYDISGLREALERYRGFEKSDMRANYARFLSEVAPAAEELGVRLCVHPDDPPRDLFGLPRIVTSEEDIGWILEQQDYQANGLTFCSGALGANPECDLAATLARYADRIHFLHLRNVRNSPDGSFFEDDHLGGDTDMVELISLVLDEEDRRREAGRQDNSIPFRPDHGHKLLSDYGRDTHPGYPLVGRMRGLAELRGVVAALSRNR